jgi:CRISPR-associated protein Cmr6
MDQGDNSLRLPQRTREIVSGVPPKNRHPGLQLDKLSVASNQRDQSAVLENVCDAAADGKLLAELLARRALQFDSLGTSAIQFDAVTSSPLTLHLGRASALENAGLCLHPIYGFAYLPGSGLKGMARAYAETVWAPANGNTADVWFKIERIFGWAAGSEGGKRWRPTLPTSDGASTGSVVFHDAWPREWPQLFVDIVNNHHSRYYGGEDPPGDWEDPVPVYFLAVKPGATFCFSLAARCRMTDPADLRLAHDLLGGALAWLGAGAKTNAGYGCFRIVDKNTAGGAVPPKVPESLLSESFELELITPAFLAGAGQSQEDCDLRPATLRGLLRWWWRTMHSGFVDLAKLRALEAAVWGSTETSGAVRTSIERETESSARQYDKRAVRDEHRLGRAPDAKTTPGLSYHSFGMDDRRAGGRSQRYFAPPGARWRITLTARRPAFQKDKSDPKSPMTASPARAMEQARAALWLLCHFGGVGSKARKGFGSFEEPPALKQFTLSQCMKLAESFRSDCGLGAVSFNQSLADSPSLQQILPWEDMAVPWTDCFYALDQLGYAAQEFAKKYKHHREKKALGLPRNIGQPEQGQFNPYGPIGNRHSSPVHYHLARSQNGTFVVRVAAFPAARLPDIASSQRLLRELLSHLRDSLRRRAEQYPDGSSRPPSSAPPRPQAPSPFMPKTPRGGRSQPSGSGHRRR